METAPKSRHAGLDILRAVAVLMVLGNHTSICPPEVSLFLNRITTVWDRGGWTGVDLFFVLSGFLISGLLLNEYQQRGDIDIKQFLIRRGLKIYPAFWFLLSITLLLTLTTHQAPYRGGYLSELLFLQNYHPSIWGHTWSLAVEEHFYVFLSALFLLLLVLNRRHPNKTFALIPGLFTVIAVASLLLRYWNASHAPVSYEHNIEPTHLRMDSLFFGVFLSFLWNCRGLSESKPLQRYRYLVGLIGIGCFLPAFLLVLNETPWLYSLGLTLFYLGGGCLLLTMLKVDFKRNSVWGRLANIGKYSYSIYLWNPMVDSSLTRFTHLATENWILYALLSWAGTFAMGIGTAKLIEYPVLKLRDKMVASRIPALRTPSRSDPSMPGATPAPVGSW